MSAAKKQSVKRNKWPTKPALMLRTCSAEMTAHGGFAWPRRGMVEAPDWDPRPRCGGGLHGLLWGEGEGWQLNHNEGEKNWLVCEIDEAEAVAIGGKIKVPRARVVHVGNRYSATAYLATNGGAGRAISFGNATAGDYGTATTGNGGTANAGDRGIATAGNGSTANAGHHGTATAGNYGTATAGDRGIATAGYHGTATAGDRGTATAGNGGTATAGDRGIATAGNGGTATAGYHGTATAGDRGTATAGDCGTVEIRYWDDAAERYRKAIGYTGEDGIEAGVAYRVEGGKLVPTAGT